MWSLATCALLLSKAAGAMPHEVELMLTNFKAPPIGVSEDWKQRLLHLRLAVAKRRLSLTYAHQDHMDISTCVVIFCLGLPLDAAKIKALGGIAVSEDKVARALLAHMAHILSMSCRRHSYLKADTDTSSSTRDSWCRPAGQAACSELSATASHVAARPCLLPPVHCRTHAACTE
jgi:hypothetical protein